MCVICVACRWVYGNNAEKPRHANPQTFFESSGLDMGREMTLCSLNPVKSHSDSRVDKSPPSAAKLIESKIEGEGLTLHPSHMHASSGSGGGKGRLPDLPTRPLCEHFQTTHLQILV